MTTVTAGSWNPEYAKSGVAEFRISHRRSMVFEPRFDWYDAVVARLTKLAQLPPGWDGYRGRPVSFENAHFALSMLKSICLPTTPPPDIVPGPNGDLQIEWHTKNGDIELDILGPYDVEGWHQVEGQAPAEEPVELNADFTDVAKWLAAISEPPSAAITAAA
jgi:hypothetical protein